MKIEYTIRWEENETSEITRGVEGYIMILLE